MKVLILGVTAGEGHLACARALEETFLAHGDECLILDTYQCIHPWLKEFISRGYLYSIRYAGDLYGAIYELNRKKHQPSARYAPSKIINRQWANLLYKEIEHWQPDVIVSTHVFPASMVSWLSENGRIKAFTAAIITDFTVHPFWEEARQLDLYVCPHEALYPELQRKGIDLGKVIPCGIPVKREFYKRTDPKEARRKLGLDPDLPTLLLMGGSMGYVDVCDAMKRLDALDLEFQTIVTCGRSRALLKKAGALLTRKRFDLYGWTDQVSLMMDAADLLVSKPGGITTSEALAKGIPLVMVDPIPGQEARNARLLSSHGIARWATKAQPLEQLVRELLAKPVDPEPYTGLRAAEALYQEIKRRSPHLSSENT